MHKRDAEQLLQHMLNNPLTQFREGQWEAIDSVVNQRRKLLVVQRTGWGKSAVYFISCKIFRQRGMGPTIIISPLLALMRNQIAAAARLGIKAQTLNSTNKDEWQAIVRQIRTNDIDCLLVSPERFANDEFRDAVLAPIAASIALLVVDEAHCISDWGHDFRPDYRRILNTLRQLPPGTPVLGTTATANNRVIADIRQQLGDIIIQRGTLARESLALDALRLPDRSSRLAWLASVIPVLPGSGIVYTLTTRDADWVAAWLQQNHIEAYAYYSDATHPDFTDSNAWRIYLEEALQTNSIKVLVATTALGMGYDKSDLSFVIHYQMPASIVGYYQQVGRAGRGIEHAVGILLSGAEDRAIHDFFRENAFPSLAHVQEILNVLENNDGLTISEIEVQSNLHRGQIEKTLKLLSVEFPSPVLYDNKRWRRTAVPFVLDQERIDHLTRQREQELAEVQEYIDTQGCKMAFLRSSLDEENPTFCGKCSACTQMSLFDPSRNDELIHHANLFLQRSEIPLHLNKQVAAGAFNTYPFRGNFPATLRAQEGRILSRWGEAGWGQLVAQDKHAGYFSDALVSAAAGMILQRWQPSPEWVCCVPSLHHPDLVSSFAKRLAEKLELPFVDVVAKVIDNQPQKLQQNRYHQCRNLDGVFNIITPLPSGNVLLVDDVVDSGWTLTILAALLRQAGSGEIFPLALATTSVKNG